MQRVAEGEVVLLDADDVREVGPEVQLDGERERGARLVADDHVILEAVADEPVSCDREGVLLEPARERVAGVEGGREVLDPARREQERTCAVDRERERREKARVVRVEPTQPAADVAELVTDAEGRALEDGQRHAAATRSLRTTRAPLDWASALITISSRFTCSGRVRAKRTHSATSSGVTGSSPS